MVHNKMMSTTTIMSSTLRNSSSAEGSWSMNTFLLQGKVSGGDDQKELGSQTATPQRRRLLTQDADANYAMLIQKIKEVLVTIFANDNRPDEFSHGDKPTED